MEYLVNEAAIRIRRAVRQDATLISDLIYELALYENAPEKCHATPEKIESSVFDRGEAKVLIAELEGTPVGFALYFYNYSTWMAGKGLYLEDLFVRPEARGKGIGKKLLKTLAGIAADEGCSRFDWVCLDWNEPSIAFYKKMGAVPLTDWTIYRLDGEALAALAEGE